MQSSQPPMPSDPLSSNSPAFEPLASLSLTHVQYSPSNPVNILMAYISLFPLTLIVAYVTLILFRRDLTTILMFVGQLTNEAVNFAAKKIVRQARPTEYLGKGYGMPSSHSQFVGYFAVWVMVYGAYRLTFRHKLYKPVLSLLALASALLVGYSRIHLNYHTPHQVMVGLLCGAAYAIVWFLFTEYVVRPNVNLDSKLARMLLLRDYRCVENVVRWEYERVRALSPSGQMKTQKKGKRL